MQDPAQPVDIGCAIQFPVRTSPHASILQCTYDPENSPTGIENKPFEFDCLTITTRGRWEFHGANGRHEVDADTLQVGVAGDRYGCRHHRHEQDENIVVALRPGALDADAPPLFAKQIIPSGSALRLAQKAVRADTTDGFESLIFAIFEEASSLSRGDAGRRVPAVRMQRAKRFIELHAFEPVTMNDIAKELGLSVFSLARQFRSATGKSPYGYLLELRLERACRLLSTTPFPIASIARRVGFEDPAHFSRWFAKCMRSSPTSFRANHR